MKYLYLIFLVFCLFISCDNSSSKETSDTNLEEPIIEEELPAIEENTIEPKDADSTDDVVKLSLNSFVGYYTGFFSASVFDESKRPSYDNKITISIDQFKGDSIFGHSIVAGNKRPFKGVFTRDDITIHADVYEPGDDRYDGRFIFDIKAPQYEIQGKWTAYNKKLAVTERKYTLESKEFTYQAEIKLPEHLAEGSSLYNTYDEETGEEEMLTADVLSFNPSTTLLKKEDIENMYQGDLEVLRNSIYARHGYSFKNRRMRYIFDHWVDWYMPVKTNILSDLTTLEKKNIDLLKRYENHAEKYYDSFGR